MRYLDIYKTFPNLKTNFGSISFRFSLERNKMILEPYYKLIENVKTNLKSEEFKKFEDTKINFLRQHGEKDENGELIFENGNLKIEDEYVLLFYKLLEENKDLIKKQELLDKEFDEFLKKEIELDFEYIQIEDLPDEIEGMSDEDREAIFNFVK